MIQRSRREAAYKIPDPVLTRLVWLAALWLGSRLIAGVIAAPFLGEGAQLDPARLVITQVPFWAATVGGLYWISRREGERFGPFVRWGFKPPDALVGLVAGFGLHWGVNLLYRALDSVGVSGDPSESARKLVEASPGVLGKVTLVVMVSVGAPLVEELYYRGVAQRTAVELAGGTAAPCVNRRSALGAAIGIGAVAVFFALSHINSGADLIQVPGLVLVGVVLGTLTWRFDRLGASIVTHGVFNLCSLLVLWGVSTPLLAG